MAAKKTAKKTAAKATKATPRASKPKMGRPPKGPEVRSEQMGLRLSPSERTEIQDAAERHGMAIVDILLTALRAYDTR